MSEPAAVVATTETSEAIAAAAAALTDVTATAVAVTAAPVAVAATTNDPVVAAAASAPIVMNEPTKIIPAIALPVPKRDPNVPSERDVIVSSDNHRGTMLLHDLVRLHYFLWRKEKTDAVADESKVAAKEGEDVEEEKKPEPTTKVEPPTDPKDVEELATHLAQLFAKGRPYEMSGLKDVPTPFFKGEGFFFENVSSSEEEEPKWNRLDEDGAKGYVSSLILSLFGELCSSESNDGDDNGDTAGIIELVTNFFANSKIQKPEAETKSSPRPCDVLFLPADSTLEDNLTYEPHQSGNKHLLFLASQYVSVKTKESASRIKAALALITSKVQVSSGGGTDLVDTDPRYVIQRTVDGQNSWSEMDHNEIAEFATIFVFEIYLEKRIYEETVISPNNLEATANVTPNSLQPTMNDLLSPSTANIPSTEPIPAPTTHDVLFGRGYVQFCFVFYEYSILNTVFISAHTNLISFVFYLSNRGMTNGHGGNRRFRDIIALHRPDYVQATKMDKPNVARKIVRAIRSGNPPGRFLRKGLDNNWRDVGDKVAAEKTSQGLRERSNAEKRQRSAQRESLRIGREGAAVTAAVVEPDSKKIKLDGAALSISADSIIPASMNAKKVTNSVKKIKKGTDEESENPTESLPANAVDKDGNVLVTDHGMLEIIAFHSNIKHSV
jgi:hypothetical protein